MSYTEANDVTPCLEGALQINSYDYLHSRSMDYISFMNQVVTSDNSLFEHEIPHLFALNLQKIANGKILLEDRTNLITQLTEAKEICGKTTITLLDKIISERDHASVLRFIFSSEKIGNYTTMAMLHFNTDGQIYKINEVFNIYNDGW